MKTDTIRPFLEDCPGRKITLTPDLLIINDDRRIGDAFAHCEVKPEFRENVVVMLDHDMPAGSFESALLHKRLIALSKANALEFIQGAGTCYHVMLERRVGEGMVCCSIGEHGAVWGAAGALGITLSADEISKCLQTGEICTVIPERAEIKLTGSLAEGVSAYDAALGCLYGRENAGLRERLILFREPESVPLSRAEKSQLCILARNAGAFGAIFTDRGTADYTDTWELDCVKRVFVPPAEPKKAIAAEGACAVDFSACFIGGCAGGLLHELRAAADVLRGKKIKRGLRLLINAASNEIFLAAMQEGIIDVFLDSGAQVATSGCGSCKTDSLGVVGDGETLLSTGCYQYPGCAGTENSEVYLASAVTVARTALTGRIC